MNDAFEEFKKAIIESVNDLVLSLRMCDVKTQVKLLNVPQQLTYQVRTNADVTFSFIGLPNTMERPMHCEFSVYRVVKRPHFSLVEQKMFFAIKELEDQIEIAITEMLVNNHVNYDV